jgi:hypothetical protein
MNQEFDKKSSTFHNFSSCIYTAQGKVICQDDKKKHNKLPILLESFINTLPNQKDTDCIALNKKLSNIVSGYNCNSETQNNGNECVFNFKCNQKPNECSILNKNLSGAVSNYNCSTKIKNDSESCDFQFDCK